MRASIKHSWKRNRQNSSRQPRQGDTQLLPAFETEGCYFLVEFLHSRVSGQCSEKVMKPSCSLPLYDGLRVSCLMLTFYEVVYIQQGSMLLP